MDPGPRGSAAADDASGAADADSAALARAWAARIAGLAEAENTRRVDEIVAAAAARGDPRAGWQSRAWAAIGHCNGRVQPADVAAIDAIVADLRAQPRAARALRLAEAAQGMAAVFDAARQPAALARLDAQGDADADPRPPAERVWTDAVRAFLLTGTGRYDEALAATLAAHRLARASGLPLCEFIAARAMSYVFLSTGDVEGALGAFEIERAASRGTVLGRVSGRMNRLLALILAGQPQRVREMLREDPWLDDPATRAGQPTIACLVACALAQTGDVEGALARLPDGDTGVSADEPQLRANRAWARASVLLAAGRAAEARDALQAFVADATAQGIVLSPMNGTQIQRVLSEACEAAGDLPGALAALKASQAHCFTWVASSVRTRLVVLQSESGAAGERFGARLQAVDDAARGLEASASTAAVAAAASPDDDALEAGRRRFVAHVAHEMRNPLNGLVGMTSLLMLSDLDERQRGYVQLAQSSAHMLMQLCSDVLDLARIDAGHFALHPEPMDPAEHARRTVQMLEPLARAKGLPVSLDLGAGLPRTLLADPLRLQQLLMNLLSNAIKFTPAGRIDVCLRWDAAQLRVEVRDTGPGLDAAARAGLFREFAQVGPSRGGTGLGLALCRSLVEQMGGEIGVDSEPGRGSCFWYRLPLSLAAPAAAASAPA